MFQIELRGEVPEQQLVELGPAHLDRLDDQEGQRKQDDDGDHDGDGREQRRQRASSPLVPSGRRSRAHKSWASCSSLIASAPVPSWAIVIPFGWSWSKGVSGCAVVTPEAIGYSKLSLWAMISWPSPR